MFDCSGTYGDSDANIHSFLKTEKNEKILIEPHNIGRHGFHMENGL